MVNDPNFHFPNLPYLKHNNKFITESQVIPKYIAHVNNRDDLFGKTFDDTLDVERLFYVINDVVFKVFTHLKADNNKELFEKDKQFILNKFAMIEKYIKDKDYYLDYLTFGDFRIFALYFVVYPIYKHYDIESDFEQFKNIKRVFENVRNLEGVKDYLENDPKAKRDFLFEGFFKIPMKIWK